MHMAYIQRDDLMGFFWHYEVGGLVFSYFLGISQNKDVCIKLLGNFGKSPINNFGFV